MDVPTFTWKQVVSSGMAPGPLPRHGHRAVVTKDLMVMFGGGNEGIFSQLHVYNLSSNEWFEPPVKGDIPPGCAAHSLTADGNRIFLYGGMIEYQKYSGDLYVLDVTEWEWKKLTPVSRKKEISPSPRIGHSFTRVGNRMYLFGGLTHCVDSSQCTDHGSKRFNNYDSQFQYLNDMYALKLHSNLSVEWSKPKILGMHPCPRESHTGVAYTNPTTNLSSVVIYGGMNGTRLGDVWFYDIQSKTWHCPIIHGVPPAPRSLHSSTIVGKRMYIFGGWVPVLATSEQTKFSAVFESRWHTSNEMRCFNVETMEWEKMNINGVMPAARVGHSAATMLSRLVIWSGRNSIKNEYCYGQICGDDMWYIDFEKPGRAECPRLIKAGTTCLEIGWSPLAITESYALQIQKYVVPPKPPKATKTEGKKATVSAKKPEILTPSDPAVDPVVPVDPVAPVVDPVDPVVGPVDPVIDPVDPVVDPVASVIDPVDPVVSSTTLSTEPPTATPQLPSEPSQDQTTVTAPHISESPILAAHLSQSKKVQTSTNPAVQSGALVDMPTPPLQPLEIKTPIMPSLDSTIISTTMSSTGVTNRIVTPGLTTPSQPTVATSPMAQTAHQPIILQKDSITGKLVSVGSKFSVVKTSTGSGIQKVGTGQVAGVRPLTPALKLAPQTGAAVRLKSPMTPVQVRAAGTPIQLQTTPLGALRPVLRAVTPKAPQVLSKVPQVLSKNGVPLRPALRAVTPSTTKPVYVLKPVLVNGQQRLILVPREVDANEKSTGADKPQTYQTATPLTIGQQVQEKAAETVPSDSTSVKGGANPEATQATAGTTVLPLHGATSSPATDAPSGVIVSNLPTNAGAEGATSNCHVGAIKTATEPPSTVTSAQQPVASTLKQPAAESPHTQNSQLTREQTQASDETNPLVTEHISQVPTEPDSSFKEMKVPESSVIEALHLLADSATSLQKINIEKSSTLKADASPPLEVQDIEKSPPLSDKKVSDVSANASGVDKEKEMTGKLSPQDEEKYEQPEKLSVIAAKCSAALGQTVSKKEEEMVSSTAEPLPNVQQNKEEIEVCENSTGEKGSDISFKTDDGSTTTSDGIVAEKSEISSVGQVNKLSEETEQEMINPDSTAESKNPSEETTADEKERQFENSTASLLPVESCGSDQGEHCKETIKDVPGEIEPNVTGDVGKLTENSCDAEMSNIEEVATNENSTSDASKTSTELGNNSEISTPTLDCTKQENIASELSADTETTGSVPQSTSISLQTQEQPSSEAPLTEQATETSTQLSSTTSQDKAEDTNTSMDKSEVQTSLDDKESAINQDMPQTTKSETEGCLISTDDQGSKTSSEDQEIINPEIGGKVCHTSTEASDNVPQLMDVDQGNINSESKGTVCPTSADDQNSKTIGTLPQLTDMDNGDVNSEIENKACPTPTVDQNSKTIGTLPQLTDMDNGSVNSEIENKACPAPTDDQNSKTIGTLPQLTDMDNGGVNSEIENKACPTQTIGTLPQLTDMDNGSVNSEIENKACPTPTDDQNSKIAGTLPQLTDMDNGSITPIDDQSSEVSNRLPDLMDVDQRKEIAENEDKIGQASICDESNKASGSVPQLMDVDEGKMNSKSATPIIKDEEKKEYSTAGTLENGTSSLDSKEPKPKELSAEWHDVAEIVGTSYIVQAYNVKESNDKLRKVYLSPGTVYQIRIAGVNACGKGPWSDLGSFKTCTPGFPGSPSSVKISKIPEGALVCWDPPPSSTDVVEYSVYLAIGPTEPSVAQSARPQLTFVRVYYGSTRECLVPNSVIASAHVDKGPKPAIIMRIAARNEKGYGPATQVRWLQESTPVVQKTESRKRQTATPLSGKKSKMTCLRD